MFGTPEQEPVEEHGGMLRSAFAALIVAGAWPVFAASPRIATPLAEHAVLQRDRPIVVTGTAAPRERLSIVLGPRSARTTADARGSWRAELKPMSAGGPYRLEVTGADGAATLGDLLIGDVWLCSGQSNMEYALKNALNGAVLVGNAADPDLRLLKMARRVAFAPNTPLPERPEWRLATSDSAADFSAACFLMVKELKARHKVPMAAIDASWGGTQIRPWIAPGAARAIPGTAEDVDLLALYRDNPAAGLARFAENWGQWWRESSGTAAGSEPWNAPDRRPWHAVPRMAAWEDWGVPHMADINGLVWFRNHFALAAAPQGDAVLDLGGIDDFDIAWVNGVPVGSSFGWGTPRRYTVPAHALRQGDNRIVVAVSDSWERGGMVGPAEAIRLTPAGTAPIMLGGGWRYSLETPDLGKVPRTPWESHAGVATLYNGMIAPLGPIALKGVAWYQGESDTGIPGYGKRMAALMAGWRQQFGDPELPFLIVGLANFGRPATQPGESGWASVRDAQRTAAASDGHAAIVTAIDIGERTDIHPANKNELAARLARAASVLAYGERQAASGPLPLHARRDGDGVVVTFDGVTGSLRAWNAAGPIGFELCDDDGCRYAPAQVDGSRVRIVGDGRPATRVRYAWADAPVVNLFDEAPLPAAPFELRVENDDAR